MFISSSLPWMGGGLIKRGITVCIFWYHSIYEAGYTFTTLVGDEDFQCLVLHTSSSGPLVEVVIFIDEVFPYDDFAFMYIAHSALLWGDREGSTFAVWWDFRRATFHGYSCFSSWLCIGRYDHVISAMEYSDLGGRTSVCFSLVFNRDAVLVMTFAIQHVCTIRLDRLHRLNLVTALIDFSCSSRLAGSLWFRFEVFSPRVSLWFLFGNSVAFQCLQARTILYRPGGSLRRLLWEWEKKS